MDKKRDVYFIIGSDFPGENQKLVERAVWHGICPNSSSQQSFEENLEQKIFLISGSGSQVDEISNYLPKNKIYVKEEVKTSGLIGVSENIYSANYALKKIIDEYNIKNMFLPITDSSRPCLEITNEIFGNVLGKQIEFYGIGIENPSSYGFLKKDPRKADFEKFKQLSEKGLIHPNNYDKFLISQ